MRGQSSNLANIVTFTRLRSLRVIKKPREGEFPANAHNYIDLLPDDGRRFALVRKSTIASFDALDDAALIRGGIADGHRVTVRALAYHIAGHELRHMNVIRERYM